MTFFLGLAIFGVAVVIFLKLADVAESPSLAVSGTVPHLGPHVEDGASPEGQMHAR
jgi:hypothetical protein